MKILHDWNYENYNDKWLVMGKLRYRLHIVSAFLLGAASCGAALVVLAHIKIGF